MGGILSVSRRKSGVKRHSLHPQRSNGKSRNYHSSQIFLLRCSNMYCTSTVVPWKAQSPQATCMLAGHSAWLDRGMGLNCSPWPIVSSKAECGLILTVALLHRRQLRIRTRTTCIFGTGYGPRLHYLHRTRRGSTVYLYTVRVVTKWKQAPGRQYSQTSSAAVLVTRHQASHKPCPRRFLRQLWT